MSAGVIEANVIRNATKMRLSASPLSPFNPMASKLPIQSPPKKPEPSELLPNEYDTSTQTMGTIPIQARFIRSMFRTFLERTMPP